KLDVAGDFEVDGSDFFVNASSGRVGIGTTSPSHTLNVVGDLNVTGTSYLGDITITADNITTNGIVSRDGNISFYNNTGGEMVRITESGRVGIGTTTPEATLVVSTSTASVGVLKLQNSNNQADDTWWLGFSHGTDSSDSNDRARIGVNILSGGAGRLVFYTGAGGSQTEQMRIDQDGNVGIGTTSPSSKLEVSGNMTIDSGTLFVDSGNNRVGIGTTAIPHGGIGAAKFAIEGTDASTAGPHIQYTTAADDYPVFQQLNWAHDNVALNFDAYYDGAWKSSDVGSNFQIRKVGDLFRINYDSVVAAGSTVIWSDGITINTTGDVGIGTTDQDTRLHVVDNVASNVMDIVNEATGSSAQGIHIQLGPTSNPGTSNNYLFFKDGDGTKVGDIDGDAAGGVRYQSVSDVRLKEHIVDTAYTLEDLLAVQVRDFNFIDGPGPTTTGFIAQELNSIYPLAVSVGSTGDIGDGDNEGEDEIWSIDYGRMTPLIIAGIQELDSKVNTLASGGSLNISIGNQSLNIETLTVSNKTTLFDVIISGLARFKDAVFTGQVSFSEDSVGQAIILEGSTEVQINFKTAYENTPVITLTPLEFIEGQYKLTEKTITGFKIILQNNQSLDIAFDWHAFGQVTENKAEVVNETSEINVTIPEETNKTNETTGESVEQELESEKNITETSKENITEVENSPITGGVINENEQEDNKTPEEIIENATEETNLTISSSIEFKNDSNNLTEEELALLNS
ncbi:MAG: tail fiber domain-containing protein, partial [Nanoarchaeota archaeon]|nr:tail fiber domain-containing protein [Nanoarchaeota archaeon]